MIVIATLVVIGGLFFASLRRPAGRSPRITCVNNLKQVGVGYRLYATDGDRPQYSETNQAWNYFQVAGQEIGSPKVLICPEDPTRKKAALDFEQSAISLSDAAYRDNALSYFYGVDSSEKKPGMILSGDRSLSTDDTFQSGLLHVKTNSPVKWAPGMHKGGGNIGLADGSVMQLTTEKLRTHVRTGTNGTQRLMLP